MMINPVNFSYTSYPTMAQNTNLRFNKGLPCDTVSFSGAYLKRTDFLELPPKKIIEICKKALKNGIKIGEGQEAEVYKIEEFPTYCIRREKRADIDFDTMDLDYDLNKYDRVNHVVAKLGHGITLMEYISGIPLKIMKSSDTASGIKVKEALQELVANNFPEASFKKVIRQIEDAKQKGIDFDRKGENLLVEAVNQEINCIDFSPNFHDVEYNPISYVYSAMDVDGTPHAPKVFGKLCKAYAERMTEVPVAKLNLDKLDTNFYHRGFIDDAFNLFPDRGILNETQKRLETLIAQKQSQSVSKKEFRELVNEFKEYIDQNVMNIRPRSKYGFMSLDY